MVKSRLLLFCALIVAIVAVGTAYNAFQNWNLNRLHPVPGKFYDVDGFAMHIYCIGSGSPTVILDSGLGNDWLIWQKVQGEIAKTNRVCSYDRAGIGWSAPRPGSRGAITIAQQMRTLLEKASIQGPLMLVGHSAGGVYVRAFAGLYPANVAGLILVDPGSPELFQQLAGKANRRKAVAERYRIAPWLYFKVATSLSRLTENYCNPNTSQRIPAVEGLARAEDCRPAYMNYWLGELDELESSSTEVAKLPCCQSWPVIILSRDPNLPVDAQEQRGEDTWNSIQEQLKQLSPQSMRIIARNSKHFLMVDRPETILDAVQTMNNQLRKLPGGIEIGRTEWQ